MTFVNAITVGTFFVLTRGLFRMPNNIIVGFWILSLTLIIIVGMLNYYFFYFPELNYLMLRRKVLAILKKFPNANIKNVFLYRTENKPSNIPTMYVVCFEPKKLMAKDVKEAQKELEIAAINLGSAPFDEYNLVNLGIDSSFENVYKQKPEKEYISQWRFMFKKDEPLPKNIQKEKSWKILI